MDADVPVGCALVAIALLAHRMRRCALVVALLGLLWLVLRDPQWLAEWFLEGRDGRRRRRRTPSPCSRTLEGFTADEAAPAATAAVGTAADAAPPPPVVAAAPQQQPMAAAPEPVTTTTEPSTEPEAAPAAPMVVDACGEYVAEHTVVGLPRLKRRRQSTTEGGGGWDEGPITSPDLQVLDRQRLPLAATGRNRLKRIVGVPTMSQYRDGTGQASSFAHLR